MYEFSSSSPIVIIDDNKSLAATAEGNLIITVVPPVGEWLTIDYITEDHHISREKNIVLWELHFMKKNWRTKTQTHLIWRHLCSHTQPSPQVESGLMGTGLVDPSEKLGGPIQSFSSCAMCKCII